MSSHTARHEFKFVLPLAVKQRISTVLESKLPSDAHAAGDGYYSIISHYYDSPDLTCYWEQKEGLQNRRKLRVRTYESSGYSTPTCFIEIKHKLNNRGVKRRLNLPLSAALSLAEGLPKMTQTHLGRASRDQNFLIKEILQMLSFKKLQPNVMIRYDRLAFQGEKEHRDLRISFDTHIQCSKIQAEQPELTPQNFTHSLFDEDVFIMEIKTSKPIPLWLRDILRDHKLRPQSLSKYGLAIEKLGINKAYQASSSIRAHKI